MAKLVTSFSVDKWFLRVIQRFLLVNVWFLHEKEQTHIVHGRTRLVPAIIARDLQNTWITPGIYCNCPVSVRGSRGEFMTCFITQALGSGGCLSFIDTDLPAIPPQWGSRSATLRANTKTSCRPITNSRRQPECHINFSDSRRLIRVIQAYNTETQLELTNSCLYCP